MIDLTYDLLLFEYRKLGRGLAEALAEARAFAAGQLSPSELERWLAAALDLREAAVAPYAGLAAYLAASRATLAALGLARFLDWAGLGRAMLPESDALGAAFFSATPPTLAHLPPGSLHLWARQGRRLHKGNARSEQLAVQFFQSSPSLFQYLSIEDAEHFVNFLDRVSEKSYTLAADCLRNGFRPFAGIEVRYRRAVGDGGPGRTTASLHELIAAAPGHLAAVAPDARDLFLGLGERLARVSHDDALAFLNDAGRSLSKVERSHHRLLLEGAARLAGLSTNAASHFLRVAPVLLQRLDEASLRSWVEEARAILVENEEAGIAFCRLQSVQAQERLAAHSRGVELLGVREVLRLYCKALTGRPVHIGSTTELAERGIGWTAVERPTTEGNVIFVPPYYESFPLKEQNFQAYKVLVTHQAAHLEFGTFAFAFARPAAHFPTHPVRRRAAAAASAAISDYQRLFDLFADRRLGRDIFTVVEDTRVDAAVRRQYRGVRGAFAMMQAAALAGRPALTDLPLREALVEVLLRLSLDAPGQIAVPRGAGEPLRRAAALLARVRAPGATVEDSAEAALRIYAILAAVPNVRWQAEDEAEAIDLEELRDLSSEFQVPGSESDGDAGNDAESAELETRNSELPYHDMTGVDYRGDLKPELVQTLQRLTQPGAAGGEARAEPITPQQLQQLLAQSAEIEWRTDSEGISEAMELHVLLANLMREHESVRDALEEAERRRAAGGDKLPAGAVESFVYDEWDFRARDYRPDWCRVRQQTLDEGSLDFYNRTLQTHAGLVASVRKQFEMLRPELLRRRKRLLHGDEIDLDAAIDHVIDRRTRHSPTEKVYWRKNKDERDVAVALLLDMSASTDEQIRPAEAYGPDGQRLYERGKRIIDIEKESIVLLIKALESIGDRYGIYGFSGHGRGNVQFFVIKELAEEMSDSVKRRLDRVVPVQGTRMGSAIRHTIAKLERTEARTKILMVLSDGRPQDYDYGRDPGDVEYSIHSFMEWMVMPSLDEMLDRRDKEYAIHDTKQALNEAKQRAIIPFCLSVDRAGHDYLKAMCGDIGYEVVSEIEALPKRLPALYRKLTT